MPGARVGSFVVKAVSENRLTLRGSRTFAAWQVTGGVIAMVIGLLAWASVLRGDAAATGAHGKVLFLPLVGVMCIAFGLLQFAEVWEFDRASRMFARFGFFGHEVLPSSKIGCVRVTALPTNLKQRETLVLELIVGIRQFPIGRRRSTKPDAANLLAAAERIATMLQVPIETIGNLDSAPPEVLVRFADFAARHRPPLNRAA